MRRSPNRRKPAESHAAERSPFILSGDDEHPYESAANAEWILGRLEQRARMLEAWVKAQHDIASTTRAQLCVAIGDIEVDIMSAREHAITSMRSIDRVMP